MPEGVELFLNFLDLGHYGITEVEVRGGSAKKMTDHPWLLPAGPKQVLRGLLRDYGFDIEKDIEVREFIDRDGFLLRQGDPKM